MDFFKVPDNRGRLSVGLRTLSALNPSSRQRSEVNSTYNCEANITYSSDLTPHFKWLNRSEVTGFLCNCCYSLIDIFLLVLTTFEFLGQFWLLLATFGYF